MPSDEVAAIRPLVVEVYEAEEAAAGEFMATFEHSENPELWVQVVPRRVNLFYPSEQAPLQLLDRLGVKPLAGMTVLDWKPGGFATLDHEAASAMEIARFVDSIFSLVFGCGEEYPVDCEIVSIGAR